MIYNVWQRHPWVRDGSRREGPGAQNQQTGWDIFECHWNVGIPKYNLAMLARAA